MTRIFTRFLHLGALQASAAASACGAPGDAQRVITETDRQEVASDPEEKIAARKSSLRKAYLVWQRKHGITKQGRRLSQEESERLDREITDLEEKIAATFASRRKRLRFDMAAYARRCGSRAAPRR